MRIIKKIGCALLLVNMMVPITAARAGAGASGFTTTVITNRQNRFFFYHSGARTGRPACAVESTRWVVDLSTPAGQAMMAQVMTAISLNKSFSVSGAGTCDLWADTETVDYIYMPI